MKFDLKTPCSNCPFRTDVRPYLNKARAKEIALSVTRNDKTFACHKTTGIGGGKRILRKDHQACAGSMILSMKTGWRNAMYQIAERFGWLDSSNLNMKASVFHSAQEMIDANA